MGDCAECSVFSGSFRMLSETVAIMDCTLCELCGLDYRGICSSMAAQQMILIPASLSLQVCS